MKNGIIHRVLLVVAQFFIVAALCGCASVVQPKVPSHYSSELADVLSGQLILGHPVQQEELPSLDLFGITPEMADFAEQAVKGSAAPFEKVRALHNALLSPTSAKGWGIRYSAYTTETPIVTFAQRQANCLSFSLLYVALARHLGINAKINQVQIPPTWNLRNENEMFFMQHVNVRVTLHQTTLNRYVVSDDTVIDLEMGRYRSTYIQYFISDDLVAAEFYNNRAMESVAQGNVKQGFLFMVKALQENNEQSYMWSNLAGFYLRQGFLREAELAYVHGLELNREDFTIMNNLSILYERMGKKSQAEHYNQLAKRFRQTNPYYHYTLAITSLEAGNPEDALKQINTAFLYEKKDSRLYDVAIQINERLGRYKVAEALQKKRDALVDRKN